MYLIAVMPSPAVYIAVDGGFYDSGRDEEDKQRFRAVLDDGLRRLQEAGHTAKGAVARVSALWRRARRRLRQEVYFARWMVTGV